jgi:xylulokinase
MGVVNSGQAVSILGTTLCNEIVVNKVDTDDEPMGILICSGVDNKRWIQGYATMCGTEAIGWLCEVLGNLQPAQISAMAHDIEPGADGVIFLPYLSPAGERAPFLDPYARGTFMGLSLHHSRKHLARAVFEGLSFVIRECLEMASPTPDELHVCGGGASSDLWCQLIADVTSITVQTSTATEAGARGALCVGSAAVGKTQSIEEAARKYTRLGKTYRPDIEMSRRYEELYQSFLAVRNNAAHIWPRQAATLRHQQAFTFRPV